MRLLIELRVWLRAGGAEQRPHGNHVDLCYIIHDHDFFEQSLGLDGLYLPQLLYGGDKNHASTRVLEEIKSLIGSERRIDRDVDNAATHAGKVCDHPLGAVLTQNGHAV